jgi:hypothetical protein
MSQAFLIKNGTHRHLSFLAKQMLKGAQTEALSIETLYIYIYI